MLDRDGVKAARVARALNLQLHACSEDLQQVDWLDEVDALTIGTAPFAHCALACAALKAGKHVLTEKPFAMSVAEGEQMLRMAGHRTLSVTHNFQFASAVKRLEIAIARGQLGQIVSIDALQLGNSKRRLPSWFEHLPFGLFYDESPHFFYLLHRLAGGQLTLRQAWHWRSSYGHATPARIGLTYASMRDGHTIPVTVNCQFDSPVSEWHITVQGTKGMGIIDIFRDICLLLPNDEQHTLPTILRSSLWATAQHWAQHMPNGIKFLTHRLDYGNDDVFRRFERACRTNQPDDRINADAALAVLKLQHEAIEAAQRNALP